MIHSSLLTVARHFSRHLSYSIISLSGLIVGITTSILVFLWATYEFTYDRYHPDNSRVFSILLNETIDGEVETLDDTPIQLAHFLINEVPEVEAVTRFDFTKAYLTQGDRNAHEDGVYADPDHFRVFNPTIVAGNVNSLLPDKHSIVISEKMAHQLFPNRDVLGKTITLDLKTEFKVTGVFGKFPDNSSGSGFGEFVLPFDSKQRDYAEDWESTIIKLRSGASSSAVEQKINRKLSELSKDDDRKALLFCLTDWRLYWGFENGEQSGGRIVYVITFCVTALFILVMACVNYMNLATARAAQRAREIGVRKMSGATRPVLIRQFMTESLVITFVASLISLLTAYLLLPLFNELTRTQLTLSMRDPILITGLLVITLFAGLLAGSYPALLLSSLKPAAILKGNLFSTLAGAGLRKTLVVFQFTLSIIMIFSALILWQQTDYLLKKDLGFDQHNVLYVEPKGDSNFPYESFKTEILRHPSIVGAGIGAASPMEVNGAADVGWPGKPDQERVMMNGASADYDYFSTLGFEFVRGRNFSREFISDSSAFVITQKAADLLPFEDPIGEIITYNMFYPQQGKIIGVIKDFHNEDIHAPIDPVVFCFGNTQNYGEWGRVFIKYKEGQLDAVLTHLKTVFNQFQPGIPMVHGFLDRDFEVQFYREKLLKKLSVCCTVIAVLIACLGLFGLTMFTTQRRTKEIGVRKVLGASVAQVVIMLCRDFARPVLISFLVAFPLAYYLMVQFLEGYSFRITISAFAFVSVALTMMGIVLLTVSYQSFQAAIKNPVEALKTE
jgi:putative ABC transport system permease protein